MRKAIWQSAPRLAYHSCMQTRTQVSAGGVVCRTGEDGTLEVVLVATKAPGGLRLVLPKGLVAPGEDHAATALREVREETGLEAAIVAPLDPIEYWYWGREGEERVRYHKRVHFFLMRFMGGHLADHDWEVEDARWYPAADALGLAAFSTERKAIEQALGMWEAQSS